MSISKKLVKTGIFALFFLIFCSSVSADSSEFSSKAFGFSITYSDNFIAADVKLHNVALALKSKTTNFPTFNVVVESNNANLNASKADKEKAMLDSYRLVGIKDVSLLDSSEGEINGQPVFKTELKYSLNDMKMASYVALLSGADRRYILTFIDTEEGYKDSKASADVIFNSFKMTAPLSEPEGTKLSLRSFLKARFIFPALIILVVVVITVNLLRSSDND